MKNVNGKMLASLRFPLPDIDTQKAIVEFLETFRMRLNGGHLPLPDLPPPLQEQRQIVARIEELTAKIEVARSLRRQAAEEAEGLVPITLSRIFDYQICDDLPRGWRWLSFHALLAEQDGMITGPFGTLLQKAEVLQEGVPILGISNVQPNRFVPGFSDFVSLEKANELSNYRLQPEDLVIARSGTVGRSCVVPENLDSKPVMSTRVTQP